jgi:uncharacterized protein YdiU (UPF0061 family)
MDAFDPATVYSSIDEKGRYAYANQPVVAEWNLARLAEALLPLIHDDQEQAVALAVESLGAFRHRYSAAWSAGMKAKIGLPGGEPASALVDELPALLQQGRVDYTLFFRSLGAAARGDAAPARSLFPDPAAFDAWVQRWLPLGPDADAMDRANPAYIPRNHLVEEALAAATEGDLEPFARLLNAVSAPYDERSGLERYAAAAPEDFGTYRTFCGT